MGQEEVLKTVKRLGGGTRREIMEEVGLNRSTVDSNLRSLEKWNMVEISRSEGEHNQYVKKYDLTEKARRELNNGSSGGS